MILSKPKNLIEVVDFSPEQYYELFEIANVFKKRMLSKPVIKSPVLKGKIVCNFFVEPSTRTRTSFELAEKNLGMDVVNFNASVSALKKKESLKDTLITLSSMEIDLYVIRHSEPGSPYFISKYTDAQVVNAGDGIHAHPTQAILDAYTVFERFGRIEGINLTIIGDIYHSRVARSDIRLFKLLGANVTICSLPTLLPKDMEIYGVKITDNIYEATKDADVIMGLRMQLERQEAHMIPSLNEYSKYFGITENLFDNRNDHAILMHPGPINRGVELSPRVADKPYSVISSQVTNGVATRMALLYILMDGKNL